MNSLLESAITAHGGQKRWKHLRSVHTNLSVTGALFESHGMADYLKGIEIEAQLHEQKLITNLPSAKKRFLFQPDLVVIESGQKRTEHPNPRKAFEGMSQTTPWEDVHAAYFGDDGLLRRLEYAVDVLGGAKGLNYATEYREINGIMLPMKRRVHSADTQRRKVDEPVLVGIDFHEIAIQ